MSKWTRRALTAAPLLLAAGVLGAPYLSADRFKEQIRVNLEAVLRRKVDVAGEARFQLYPQPGVTLKRVVIHELPEFGVEPIAYLDYPESSLDVSLSPLSLLLGRVKVTGVRLVAPSVNLTKAADGRWTFQKLVDQALGSDRSGEFDLDALEVQGGRLNMKVGNVKSVYYLANADLRVEADSGRSGRYSLTIEGDPARTDRTTSSFGRLTGRGMLTLGGSEGESRIELSLALDRTPIAELVTALEGRSAGLGGFMVTQAKLSGPLSAIDIEGRIELNEAERFGWILPGSAAHGLGYSGLLNWPGQELRIGTRDTGTGSGPVSLRMRATDLFQRPQLGVLLGIDQAPLGSVRALAGELGIDIPSTVPVEGSLSGVVGYSSRYGTRGQLAVSDASVPIPSLPAVKVAMARVLVDNQRWTVPAAEIAFSDRESATVDMTGDAASGATQLSVSSAGMPVERTRQLWRFLSAGTDPPFFDRCRNGQWSGTIRADQDREGAIAWFGDVRVSGAVCGVEGLAEPVQIESALVAIRGPVLQARRVSARAGKLVVSGEVGYDPRPRRRTRVLLSAGDVQAAEVERLLMPALRRERGFLSRTLGRRVAVPEWLDQRRMDAQIRIASLTLGGNRIDNVNAALVWDGVTIEMVRLRAVYGGGSLSGTTSIAITGSEPAYQGHLDFTGVLVRDGRLDAAVDYETRGAGGSTLLAALRADGRIAVDGNPAPAIEPGCEGVMGAFTFAASKALFSNLQVTLQGGEVWHGAASAGLDGRLQLELSAGAESPKKTYAGARLW